MEKQTKTKEDVVDAGMKRIVASSEEQIAVVLNKYPELWSIAKDAGVSDDADTAWQECIKLWKGHLGEVADETEILNKMHEKKLLDLHMDVLIEVQALRVHVEKQTDKHVKNTKDVILGLKEHRPSPSAELKLRCKAALEKMLADQEEERKGLYA
jgi:hypothetical protein